MVFKYSPMKQAGQVKPRKKQFTLAGTKPKSKVRKFNAAQFTLRTERITEESEKAEKERRDKISQQKWDAERRARQYDAIAQRLST